MKTIILLLIPFLSFAQIPGSNGQYEIFVKKNTNDSVHALLHLPDEYGTIPGKKYPLLVFFHGAGEVGTDLSKIWNNPLAGGPAWEITKGRKMSFINPTNGVREFYIVVCPQSNEGDSFTPLQTDHVLNTIYSRYDVDTNRVILACISQGGKATLNYSGGIGVTPSKMMAGIIAMSAAVSGLDLKTIGDRLRVDSVSMWGAGDLSDTHAGNTGAIVYYYNYGQTPPFKAKFTPYTGYRHGGWFLVFDTAYRYEGMNIYEWGLTLKATPKFKPPTFSINAGVDVFITLPVNSVSVSVSTTGNNISTYNWAKISGPGAQTFTNPNAQTTEIKDLQSGVYLFRVLVSQSDGTTLIDTLQVTVNEPKKYQGRRITVIKGGDNGKYISGKTFPIYPGDTLVLKAANNPYSYLSLENIYGSPENPIVIINEGGRVEIGAMAANNCKYLKFTGSGTSDFYGFYMTSPKGTGTAWAVYGRSKNIEIERSEIYRETYMIWAKHEADCNDSLQYPNWYLDSISFHDNKGRNIGQDGIYFGSTSPNGLRNISCSGKVVAPIPMRLSNIKIYNNIIDSTGRTAIQVSGADKGDNEIYNNSITRIGYEYNQTQGSGIISGGVTQVFIHDNYIRQTFQNGIFILGAGVNRVENNNIDSSGYLGNVFNSLGQPCGILADTRATTPTTKNTTLIFKNNLFGKVATLDGKHIVVKSSINSYNQDNIICGNLTHGGNAADIYVEPDITNTYSGCVNVGSNILPTANAGADKSLHVSVKTVVLSGSGTDADGNIVSYSWAKISGPTFTINSTSIPNPILSDLKKGTYAFRLTVTDNRGGKDTDDITIKINP